MQANEKAAFFASLAVIAETVNRKLSKVLMKAYWACLEPYPFSTVQHALNEVLKNPDAKKHSYFPAPSDIIAIIDGDVASKSLLAWTEVSRAIREIGHYDSVVFSDELIHAVIRDMGGWVVLCQHTEKELPFVQRDFERRYRLYCQNRPKLLPRQLTGRIAHQNAVHGHVNYIPSPVTFSAETKDEK